MDILRKRKQAIDAVLEKIAPGQGHLIFELTKSSHSSELDSVTLAGLKEAVQNANGEFMHTYVYITYNTIYYMLFYIFISNHSQPD